MCVQDEGEEGGVYEMYVRGGRRVEERVTGPFVHCCLHS